LIKQGLRKKVVTLVNEQQGAGMHNVTFNAGNLSTGIYIYTLRAGSYSSTKKLILVK
jgi:hypothetical protein